MFNIKDLDKNYLQTMMKHQLNNTNKLVNENRQENFENYVKSIGGKVQKNKIEPSFRTRKLNENKMEIWSELDQIIWELENGI